jgi:hypothetical protein
MSTNTTDPAVDVACVPSAIPLGERVAHFALGRRVFAELVEERIDLHSGIALRLRGENFPQVARFIANERKCCPFLHIEVEIAPGAGPMWLRLTGPPGTRELIEAELGLATTGCCECNSLDREPQLSKPLPAKLRFASPAAYDLSQSAKAVKTFKWAAAGGIVGALAIASCCLLPLILLGLGLGGLGWAVLHCSLPSSRCSSS